MNYPAYFQGYNFQKQALNFSLPWEYGLTGTAIGAPVGAAYKYFTDPKASVWNVLGYGGLGALGGGAIGAGIGKYKEMSNLAEEYKYQLGEASREKRELAKQRSFSESKREALKSELHAAKMKASREEQRLRDLFEKRMKKERSYYDVAAGRYQLELEKNRQLRNLIKTHIGPLARIYDRYQKQKDLTERELEIMNRIFPLLERLRGINK